MQSRIPWRVDSAQTRVVLRRSCTSCTQRRFGTNARLTQTQSRARRGTRALTRRGGSADVHTCDDFPPDFLSAFEHVSFVCRPSSSPPTEQHLETPISPPPRYSTTGVPVCAHGYSNTHNLIHRSCIFKCNLVRIHTVHRQTPLNGRRLTRKCMQTRRIHR